MMTTTMAGGPPSKLVPPLNFAMVAPGIYRSGHPNTKNHPFLTSLGLKTVMFLCSDDLRDENEQFFNMSGITIIHHRIHGNKEPFQEIDQNDMATALAQVLDTRNHPILIHCNKGKHRVGCLVGCLRKLQKWSLSAIYDEYQRFVGPNKIRINDQEFIEVFDAEIPFLIDYLPKWFTL